MTAKQKQRKDKELSRLREFMQIQGKAISTERSYIASVAKFLDFICSRKWPKGSTSEAKLEAFLSRRNLGDVSSSTQNGRFHAVCYYYKHIRKAPLENVDALRSYRGEQIRQAPEKEDVRKVLMAVQDTGAYPTRLICWMLYACGLRVGETCAIRLKDAQLDAGKLLIIGGKGKKDRFINVPDMLIPQLRRQVESAEVVRKQALAMGVPTKLPHKLAVKYPKAPMQRRWFWLFPQAQPCNDPRGGGRVWWHCLEDTVQRAMRTANKRAGTEGITPHHLRHAWATHASDNGAHLRDIQEILGHKDIKTTMRYVRPNPERVPSPIASIMLGSVIEFPTIHPHRKVL
jgi:site-specific recombinase XerD